MLIIRTLPVIKINNSITITTNTINSNIYSKKTIRTIIRNTEPKEIIYQFRVIPAITEQDCTRIIVSHAKLTAPDL